MIFKISSFSDHSQGSSLNLLPFFILASLTPLLGLGILTTGCTQKRRLLQSPHLLLEKFKLKPSSKEGEQSIKLNASPVITPILKSLVH